MLLPLLLIIRAAAAIIAIFAMPLRHAAIDAAMLTLRRADERHCRRRPPLRHYAIFRHYFITPCRR